MPKRETMKQKLKRYPKSIAAMLHAKYGPPRETCACGCGKPATLWLYAKPSHVITQHQRNRVKRGKCVRCNNTPEPGRRRCRKCLNIHRDLNRTLRQKRRSNGKCTRCGKRDCHGCNYKHDVF